MEIARYLIAFVAVLNFGGLVADAIVPATARQHLFNPHCPPHAKFHNAQTRLMGLVSGTLSLAILFGTPSLTLLIFLLAAAIAANYFVTMALAPLFPKTAWIDPEFSSGTFAQSGGQPLFHLVSRLDEQPSMIVTTNLCLWRAAQRVRRRQDDHGLIRPPDVPLRDRRDRQRELAVQDPGLTA